MKLSSIRGKMIGLSLLVLLLFVCFAWVTAWGLDTISETSRAVHQETLPRLLTYQRAGHTSRSIIDGARGLSMVTSEEDLDRIATQLDELSHELQASRADLGLAAVGREGPGAELDELLGAEVELVRRILRVRDQVDRSLRSSNEALGRCTDDVYDLLLLERSAGRSDEDLRRIQDGLYQVIDLEQAVLAARDRVEVDALESRLRLEIRGLGPSLARLDEESRQLIAGPLLATLEETEATDGLFQLSREKLELEARVAEVTEAVSLKLDDLSALMSEVARASAEESKQAGERIEAARRQVLLYIAGLLLAVLAVLLFLGFYVQKSVVQRLGGLVDELTALSRGELGVRVTPGGDRELAELAEAAEIFRSNAEDLSRALDELENTNQELVQFAYVASHDLKTPLRGISNLASWVIEDCEGLLPAESQTHLDKLIERIKRMENLLEDLLRFSRVGRENSPKETVGLGAMLREAAELASPDGKLELVLPDEELSIEIRRPPLELALRNLLSNSIAHSDQDAVRVEASYKRHGETGFELDLIDDGPGIPQKHAEKVFGMFTRLSHDETGTGMGLALVRRAAEAAGGSAIVVPRDDRGAHVRLVWPDRVLSAAARPAPSSDRGVARPPVTGTPGSP